MVSFTFKDYIKYAPEFAETFQLMDRTEEYTISTNTTHQYQDKIFKDILDNKKELLNFIKIYLKNEKFNKVKEEEIENYKQKFITSNLKIKEADMIYKIKGKNVFILIEHQSKIDNNMPIRMVEYCLELGRIVTKNNNGFFPTIYPIVLYTGSKKWNVPLTIVTTDKYFYDYGIQKLNYPVYSLVDINDYSEKELLKEFSALSKALLFEKVQTREEIEKIIKVLKNSTLTKNEEEYIEKIFKYSNKLNKLLPNCSKFIEKGENNMRFIELYEELLDEKEKCGEKNGIIKMIKQMIKNHISDDQIMKIANIDKEELEKLKMA